MAPFLSHPYHRHMCVFCSPLLRVTTQSIPSVCCAVSPSNPSLFLPLQRRHFPLKSAVMLRRAQTGRRVGHESDLTSTHGKELHSIETPRTRARAQGFFKNLSTVTAPLSVGGSLPFTPSSSFPFLASSSSFVCLSA